MDIRFTGQNLKITEGMKEHFQVRLEKFEKYAPRLVEAHVFLKKEKYFYKAELTVLAKNLRAFGEGDSKENVFSAMDEAYDRVTKQLKKYRAKNKDHHKKTGKQSIQMAKVLGGTDSEKALSPARPKIIRSENFAPKPMSIEEASLQLELSPESFLVFLNQTTDTVHVLYKRKDGNHGLIEPRF